MQNLYTLLVNNVINALRTILNYHANHYDWKNNYSTTCSVLAKQLLFSCLKFLTNSSSQKAFIINRDQCVQIETFLVKVLVTNLLTKFAKILATNVAKFWSNV